jgi:hypothetical protein
MRITANGNRQHRDVISDIGDVVYAPRSPLAHGVTLHGRRSSRRVAALALALGRRR